MLQRRINHFSAGFTVIDTVNGKSAWGTLPKMYTEK